MRHICKGIAALITLSIIAPSCQEEGDTTALDPASPPGAAAAPLGSSEIMAVKTRAVDGQSFTFMKVLDKDGEIKGVILDADGNEIDESALPRVQPSKISPDLQAAIDGKAGSPQARGGSGPLQVTVALVDEPEADDEPMEWGEAIIDADGRARVIRNGVEVTDEEILAANEERFERIAARREARMDRRRASLRALSRFHGRLAEQPGMAHALEHGRGEVTLTLMTGEVEALLREHDHLIAGMELAGEPADEIAGAILDTGVDPHAIDYSDRRGSGIGIYMSEGGCPDAGHITKYQRLSGSADDHNKNVSGILRGVSPDSFVYCRSGYVLASAADLAGYDGNPRVYIETHSWGSGPYNTEYRADDRSFDDQVYDNAVAVFKSAGNYHPVNNPSCNVSTPGKGLNLIMVGNYDDSNDTINSGSCHVDSEIGNVKPELSAPGTSITAGGVTMSGTSMASPHAAGFAADLMSSYSWLRLKPYYLKASMLAGADKSVSGGADKVGVGGLSFYRNYYNSTNTWWEGDNASFSTHDANDYLPNNGFVDRAVTLDASMSNVRVALAWLNRGSYTYDHRADDHPIGMDLDMCVLDPSGNSVGCSGSYDNPYELVSFDPSVTGTYRVRIHRFVNRDTSSKLHMGVSIDWN